jgi:hypothetical protein
VSIGSLVLMLKVEVHNYLCAIIEFVLAVVGCVQTQPHIMMLISPQVHQTTEIPIHIPNITITQAHHIISHHHHEIAPTEFLQIYLELFASHALIVTASVHTQISQLQQLIPYLGGI